MPGLTAVGDVNELGSRAQRGAGGEQVVDGPEELVPELVFLMP